MRVLRWIARVAVLDRPYATTGQCGEWLFPATPPAKPTRVLNRAGDVLKCK